MPAGPRPRYEFVDAEGAVRQIDADTYRQEGENLVFCEYFVAARHARDRVLPAG